MPIDHDLGRAQREARRIRAEREALEAWTRRNARTASGEGPR